MNNQTTFLLLLTYSVAFSLLANKMTNYITFNDRRNVVHGVYVGIGMAYGEIEGQDTYIGSFKVATSQTNN